MDSVKTIFTPGLDWTVLVWLILLGFAWGQIARQRVTCLNYMPVSTGLKRLNAWTARMRAVFLGALFLVPIARTAAAADWFTRTWQTEEGLLDNTITAITQTRDGFLWVGTSAGLVRFDGVNFVEVPYLPDKSHQDPNVRILLPSRTGGLWIVPEIGPIVCLDSNLARVPIAATNLPADNVIGIAEDQESLWIGLAAGSIYRVDPQSKIAIDYGAKEGVPAGTINSFLTDSDGNVWLAKAGSICVLRDNVFEKVMTTRGKVHVIAARTNGVWITVGVDVFKCTATGKPRLLGAIQTSNPSVAARTLVEDRLGGVWVGTDSGGLYHFQGSGFEPVEVSHPFVSCLAEDSEGNIWAGTLGGGLNRIFPSAIQLQGQRDGNSLVAIRSVCQDSGGVFWGVSQNGYVVSRTNAEWTAPADPELAALTNVSCVFGYEGDLWIGGHARVLQWHEGRITSWDVKKGLTVATSVTQMMTSSNGDLWLCQQGLVGSGAIVQRLDGDRFQSFKLERTMGRRAVLAEDSQGTFWAGTSGGMLLRFDGEKFVDLTASTHLTGRAIRNLYATPDGSLWIGYAGWGLGRLKNGTFARITSDEGLRENYISQIISDDAGWFWLGGDLGIFKVRQKELEDVLEHRSARVSSIVYGRNEGVLSQQADFTIPRGLTRTHDGKILMPMRSALAVIDPAVRREQSEPPPICLTRVVVDDQFAASYGGLNSSQVANLKTLRTPLRLDPRHRKIEFNFSGLSYATPESVRFRYRLDGFDDDWVDGGAQRSVRYSRLPAGNYQFRVAACNSDGRWKEVLLPLQLIVAPFFWQTAWFRISALALFSTILIGIARYISLRRVHSRLQALEQQAALDKSRMAGMAEVAASVLHNVGNVLNSVNVSSTIVRDKVRQAKTVNFEKAISLLKEHAGDLPGFLASDPKGKQLPDYLAGLARHFTEMQGEVLQEISSLDENIEHIKEIVVSQQQYSRAAGFSEVVKPSDVVDDALRIHANGLDESHVQIVREFEEVPAVATDKHKILQILVNLIANARHALETSKVEDRRLTVRIGTGSDERVVISVTDNGIGIPPQNLTKIFQQGFATNKNGHAMGLHSGANAARELGGSLVADSKGPGTGATFTLEFPAASKSSKPTAADR
jgi:ligand-binding sensor domain-containing protein/signal transduction histidine kinase